MTGTMRHNYRLQLNAKIIFAYAILVCICFSVILALPAIVSAEDGSSQAAAHADAKLLEGSWVRLDGGYVLELRNIADDGTLSATYFNPRPIKVFQAFWATDEGKLAVFVELRDINYPGSKYSLRYDPATDRLKGIYFQALERQSYEVEFVRSR
jgi:hypothetical protein